MEYFSKSTVLNSLKIDKDRSESLHSYQDPANSLLNINPLVGGYGLSAFADWEWVGLRTRRGTTGYWKQKGYYLLIVEFKKYP